MTNDSIVEVQPTPENNYFSPAGEIDVQESPMTNDSIVEVQSTPENNYFSPAGDLDVQESPMTNDSIVEVQPTLENNKFTPAEELDVQGEIANESQIAANNYTEQISSLPLNKYQTDPTAIMLANLFNDISLPETVEVREISINESVSNINEQFQLALSVIQNGENAQINIASIEELNLDLLKTIIEMNKQNNQKIQIKIGEQLYSDFEIIGTRMDIKMLYNQASTNNQVLLNSLQTHNGAKIINISELNLTQDQIIELSNACLKEGYNVQLIIEDISNLPFGTTMDKIFIDTSRVNVEINGKNYNLNELSGINLEEISNIVTRNDYVEYYGRKSSDDISYDLGKIKRKITDIMEFLNDKTIPNQNNIINSLEEAYYSLNMAIRNYDDISYGNNHIRLEEQMDQINYILRRIQNTQENLLEIANKAKDSNEFTPLTEAINILNESLENLRREIINTNIGIR